MSESFRTKILKLDSSKATRYDNEYQTACLFQFDEISCRGDESLVYSLLNASIPYSWHSVNKYNQYLDIEEKINNVSTNRIIIIPAGNYSSVELAKTLTQLLTTQNPAGGLVYNITYNKINNRFLINITTPNATAIFKFGTGENANESCYKLLGCLKIDLLINNVPFLSTNSVIMNDITFLQIKSDLGNNIVSSSNEDNIFEIIPINTQPYSYISYAPYQPNKYLLNQSSINTVSIELVDNENRPINLNGLSFLITIKLVIIDKAQHNIPIGVDPRMQQPSEEKTNLQVLEENPGIINIPQPYDPDRTTTLSDLIEYNIIKEMLNEFKSKNKKSKT
jgi:hypothetical protein